MLKRNYEGQWILFLLLAFVLSLFFCRFAIASDAPDGEFETGILTLVDAIHIGKMGAIIMAIVQLLKTRMASMFILWVAVRFGGYQGPVVVKSEAPELEGFKKYLPIPMPGIPNVAAPSTSLVVGALAGVAESIATGKPVGQATFEGLLSSGVSMALYDLILKPIVKKLSN